MKPDYQTLAAEYFARTGDPVKVRQHIDELCDVAAANIRSQNVDGAIANIGIAVELTKLLQNFNPKIEAIDLVRRLAAEIKRAAKAVNN